MDSAPKGKQKFEYKWVIAFLSFIMVFTVLGFCSSSKSLYVVPVTKSLKISRSSFSLYETFRYVTTSVINLFFGSLIAKFGARKLIGAGFVSLIISSLLFSFSKSVLWFYLGGVFLGLGIAWTTTTMVGAVVNKWFDKKQGTVMGFVLAANGLGSALAVQIVSPIIESSQAGFRTAYFTVAMILICVGLPLLIFFRNEPKEKIIKENSVKKTASWEGIDFKKAIGMPYFYGACLCIFFSGMMLQGITGIATPHFKDIGLDASFIAFEMSVHSVSLTLFKFLTGVVYDKFGLRKTSNFCIAASMVTMILLTLITNTFTGNILAMCYAIISTMALPLETIMISIYAKDLFGDKSFNKILGIFASVNTAGFAIGAPLANLCFDITGTYKTAFYVGFCIMASVFVIMSFVITKSNKLKKEAEKNENSYSKS